MNTGRVFVLGIALSALIAGAAMYYLQVYAYYDEIAAEDGTVVMTTFAGVPEEIVVTGFSGIDSDSSPIRYRACFEVPLTVATLTETFEVYEDPTPLVAPGWFDCFDAREIGEALEAGEAFAFMGVENITYGVDRVVAVMPDGRGFSWHQLNLCGERVFDGEAAPDGCPPVPEAYQ